MNKKSIRKILLIATAVVLLIAILGFIFNYIYNHTLPSAADKVLSKYMDSFKIGTTESARYAHFRNDEIKAAYVNAGTILYDYRVEDITRINDKLFALTILVKTNRTADSYMRVYNFLGYIDDGWYFINGIGNVPDEICENLDRGGYSYK